MRGSWEGDGGLSPKGLETCVCANCSQMPQAFLPEGSVYPPSKDSHIFSGVFFTVYLCRRLGRGHRSCPGVLEEEGLWRSGRSQVGLLLRPVNGRQKPAGVGQRALGQTGPATGNNGGLGVQFHVWISVHLLHGLRTSGRFGGQWVGTEASKRRKPPPMILHGKTKRACEILQRPKTPLRGTPPSLWIWGRAHRTEEDGSAWAELEGVLCSSGRRLRVAASPAVQYFGGGGREAEQGMRLHNRSPRPAASRSREPRAGCAAGPGCCRDERGGARDGPAGRGVRASAGGGRRRRGR